MGVDGYDLTELSTDLARFAFRLGEDDGEPLLAPTSRELTLLGEHSAPRSSSPRSGVGRPANTRRHEYIRATGEPDHSWCA